MDREPGFGSAFTAAIGAEIVVVIAMFVAAALVVHGCGKVLM